VEARQLAGHRHALNVIAPRYRRQKHLFVLAADVPHHVHAPRLVHAAFVAQRLQWNGKLRFPSAAGDAGAHGPVSIPVELEPARLAAPPPAPPHPAPAPAPPPTPPPPPSASHSCPP